MKIIFIILITNIASMLSISGAVYMAMNGVVGWGWFIFASILLASVPSKEEEQKGDSKNNHG